MMRRYQLLITLVICILFAACNEGDELLDNFTKDGPIFYAGKIDSLKIQSGFHRVKVNIYPSEDVNHAFCILKWNESDGMKDSVQIPYTEEHFDEEAGCYFTYLDLPDIEGNLLIEAQNVDIFENQSLILGQGAFVYGETYVATLLNSNITFSDSVHITFENRLRAVGNLISYEKKDGTFTSDSLVMKDTLTLVDPQQGGLIRTKTLYLIDQSDIDTLITNSYLETPIP